MSVYTRSSFGTHTSLEYKSISVAFRRFVSRRGLPKTLISDNAKTLKSASSEIERIVRDGEVKQQLANDHVEWEFIIEKALWYGGFWECMVQTVKRVLRKVIGRSYLEFKEFNT